MFAVWCLLRVVLFVVCSAVYVVVCCGGCVFAVVYDWMCVVFVVGVCCMECVVCLCMCVC